MLQQTVCALVPLLLSYLLNVSAITQPVISQTVMMQGMQPPAEGGVWALTMWDCRMSRAHREANALRSCSLRVSAIMHWTDYEQGMFLVLKGGKTTLVSLISAIVPYLRHDIKPNCQSKPKQILLEELQNGKRSTAALRGAAFNMADTNPGSQLLRSQIGLGGCLADTT